MFGLMRFRGTPEMMTGERRRWRLHYCGTCKTLGRRYGQRSRMLLNHDAVFLAEMLTALGGRDVEEWPAAYRSWNCFRLPAETAVPDILGYASAATVLLAEYKVEDHRADSGRTRWTWARRALGRAFSKARTDMASLGFPLAECDLILGRQRELEAAPPDFDAVAAPTAEATALVFRYGARAAGLDRLAEPLAAIGRRFGRLIYTLDAWEDFEQDARTGEFNGLRASRLDRDWAAQRIREETVTLATDLDRIGVPVEFGARLRADVELRLQSRFRIVRSCQTHGNPPVRERWRGAVRRARELRSPAWAAGAVIAMAFLFPVHARSVRSHSECLSLGLNAMALGGLLAAVDVGGAHKRGFFGRLANSLCNCDACFCDDCCCDCDACDCGACECGDCCGSCDCSC